MNYINVKQAAQQWGGIHPPRPGSLQTGTDTGGAVVGAHLDASG